MFGCVETFFYLDPAIPFYKSKKIIEKEMLRIVLGLAVFLLLVQCAEESTVIKKKQLGKISNSTSIEELDKIFKNDSVQKLPEGEPLVREYKVFDASGSPSLIFVTRVENDSLKALEHVKIYSPAYATEKGISTASTFEDVRGQYSIDDIEPSFSSAILFIDELNATISLDKRDLNIDEFDMRDISEDQIPDQSSILYITLWFE